MKPLWKPKTIGELPKASYGVDMKTVLLITYDFPPVRTSGVYRPVKFVKHLGNFGWRPVVLTSRGVYVEATDESLLKDIPAGTQIERAYSIDLAKLSNVVHDSLFGSPKDPTEAATSQTEGSRNHDAARSTRSSRKPWIKRFFFSPLSRFIENWLYLPDSKILWMPFALLQALSLVRREQPDVILSTSSPATAQLVGLALSLLTRRPWVVDLRDNWIVGYFRQFHSAARIRVDQWLLGRILKRADQVITMCQGNADDLLAVYPQLSKEKITSITNGYDEDDFIGPSKTKSEGNADRFTMLHIGTLYSGTAGVFFEAIAELLHRRTDITRSLQIDMIGWLEQDYPAAISRLGLHQSVRLLGFRSHPEAIQAMLDADVLLLFLGGNKIMNQQFPGKVFEYMNCQRPILTIGQPGEIVETVSRSGLGVVAPHDQTDKIIDAIEKLYQSKMENKLHMPVDMRFVKKYEYRSLTERLTRVLDNAIGRPTG